MDLALLTLGIFYACVFIYWERMHKEQEREWAAERRELLNRIKPETAQIPDIDENAIFDPIQTDEDYWRAHESKLKEEGSFPYGFEEEARGR